MRVSRVLQDFVEVTNDEIRIMTLGVVRLSSADVKDALGVDASVLTSLYQTLKNAGGKDK